jgi:CBS domain containing-hemolysin-like protein
MNSPVYLGFVVALFFSFFFTAFEVAYMMADKTLIEEDAKKGDLNSRILFFFIERPLWLIATARVGYCTALVFFGYFTVQLLSPVIDRMIPGFDQNFVTIIIQILLSSIVVLLIAQVLPKIIGNIFPNHMLLLAAVLFAVSSLFLFPVTYCILKFSQLVVNRVLRQNFGTKPLFGLTNLSQYFKNIYNIKQGNANLDFDKKILENALEFKTVKIRECMVPRTEITAIDIHAGLEKLQQSFVESGHSKIIIYKTSIDDIIGYCHSSSLFKMPAKIEDILTPVITVPETSLASDLMRRFLDEKKSLAVVMDEFGGTSGIVSREDVIEEIFGEIEDEYDEDDLIEQKLDDLNYLFSARLEIDYLNENYQWQLPIGEYETLGGLILAYTEDFPERGEQLTIDGYRFTIQSTHGHRIDTIKVTIEPTARQSTGE